VSFAPRASGSRPVRAHYSYFGMSAGPSCSTACAAVAGTRTRAATNEAGPEAPKRLIFRVQHLCRAWEKAAGLAGPAEIRAAPAGQRSRFQ
jgi:hypothetical protein